MADKPQTDPLAQQWINTIAVYEREFKKWEGRVDKITKRYRDETRLSKDYGGARFNILWSNVQTAVPAVFSRIPKPDVSRRFKDTDPVGRVAALILERALEFDTDHYSDFRSTMKECVQDRFLGGRGVAWVRYEPHMKAAELPEGEEVSEDTPPAEELDYECAPSDYVHWKDFGHTIARTWEEVTGVWRKVYMDRAACIKRFGKELGSVIPLDTKPDELKKSSGGDQQYEACIYEIWDKSSDCALWLSKSMGRVLDERTVSTDPDLPKLDNFWPCAKPLYATLTNDSLVPVPDFTLYQDQAHTLDVIADRIEGLVRALQVKGVYDAANPELGRLFTEGENNSLIPVKNWAAFAEKQGLKGAIDLVDLTPIFNALKACYEAADQQKQQIYEITGLADIIRGQSDPNETAAAQKLKGSFGSMRLRSMQADVAQFATEILQLKAQIICAQFEPDTIAKIGGAATLNEADQELVPQALQLLKTANLRDFRIEIVADSMIYMDELQEKQDRMEFLTAVGKFMQQAIPAAEQTPQIAPMLGEMLKFAATGFKVGKTLEGVIDQAIDQLKNAAANPQQKPDPELVKAQLTQQTEQMKANLSQQTEQAKIASQAQLEQFKANLEAQTAQAQQAAQAKQDALAQQMEAQREQQKMALAAQLEQHKANLENQRAAAQMAFDKWKAELDAKTKIAVAEITANAALQRAQLSAAKAEASGGDIADQPQQPQPQGAD